MWPPVVAKARARLGGGAAGRSNSLIQRSWVSKCDTVKNITVSVDDQTYRRARIRAAELDTSLSALVKRYLLDLAGEESEFERLAKLERELRDRIGAFRANDSLPKGAIHERRR